MMTGNERQTPSPLHRLAAQRLQLLDLAAQFLERGILVDVVRFQVVVGRLKLFHGLRR